MHIWLPVVITLACLAGVLSGTLDLQRCTSPLRTGVSQKVLQLNATSLIRKDKAVSNAECIAVFCLKQPKCLATFYNKLEGDCYQLAHPTAGVLDEGQSGIKGQHTSMMNVNGFESSCSSVTCPAGTTCMTECDSTGAIITLCVEDNSNCDISEEYTNIRHFFAPVLSSTLNYQDPLDDGIVQTVNYPKTRATSALRVKWHSVMRGHCNQNGCSRWWFAFNGSECTTPYTIDYLDFNEQGIDDHRSGTIDGTCYGLPAGLVTIDIRVGACPNYGVYDAATGYSTPKQWTIMEILPQVPLNKPCPGLTLFNYAYAVWKKEFNNRDAVTSVFWTGYKKLASDTSLRIKYETNMRVFVNVNGYQYCGRWSIRIDGAECSPLADVIINTTPSTYGYLRNHLKHRTVEAICENIAAGMRYVEVYTGNCYETYQEAQYMYTGWNSPTRMHIEEVRLSKLTEAVITPDKRIVKNPFFNIVRFHYWHLADQTDSGLIKANTYVKRGKTSALRLLTTGDHRTYNWQAPCSRWYFLINGAACTNPGPIEGLWFIPYGYNYHNPMQVSGVCYGLAPGTYTIGYYVGPCAQWSGVGEAFTGWGSALSIIIEEMAAPELAKSCTNLPVVNCN